MLNKYSVSTFSAEDTNNLPLIDTSTYHDINVLSHIELSLHSIYKKLKFFKQEQSPGVDNIYPYFPLCSIYQQSLECNVIPEDWKLANVTNYLKKAVGAM